MLLCQPFTPRIKGARGGFRGDAAHVVNRDLNISSLRVIVAAKHWARAMTLLLGVVATGGVIHAADIQAGAAEARPAERLRLRYDAAAAKFARGQFNEPLLLDSEETAGTLKGTIYARVDYPFAAVSAAFNGPHHWCDVLILHLNIKYCRLTTARGDPVLQVNIGTKKEQALDDSHRVEFIYRNTDTAEDYFQVELKAGKGPLSTKNLQMTLEAVAIDAAHTALNFTYSYDYGLAGSLALKSYLVTLGKDKVGFTVVDPQSNGTPQYIGGVRGLTERNTMRYYLAIDAYLATRAAPPREQLNKRLDHWFAATERYARQLHEISRDEYLSMKRREYQRQLTAQ